MKYNIYKFETKNLLPHVTLNRDCNYDLSNRLILLSCTLTNNSFVWRRNVTHLAAPRLCNCE
jgi:hypothetical protein